MPTMALPRVAARVVGSGPGGENLATGTWRRLEALPDSRSRQGRVYPLACLVAVAVRAFTAAGNDRFTAAGQWIRRASQADLARLRAPWDPQPMQVEHAPALPDVPVVPAAVTGLGEARATAGRATVLVRSVDEIPGTHRTIHPCRCRSANCLVLTNWTSHLQAIADALRARGHDPVTLKGGMGAKDRATALARLTPQPGGPPLLAVATGPYAGEGQFPGRFSRVAAPPPCDGIWVVLQ